MSIARLTVFLTLLALPISACKATKHSPDDKKPLYLKSDPNIHQPSPRRAASKRQSARQPAGTLSGTNAEISSISIQDLFTLQQKRAVIIFDARPAYFYRMGHIPGAINLPSDHCDQRIQKLKPAIKAALAEDKIIAVYCSGVLCKDARTVAHHLAKFGYPVHKFYGGWNAWQDAELPIEKSPP